MAKILVYNNNTNRMETYYRGEDQSMPYNSKGTLRVKEFRGASKSGLLWTDRRAMEAWNSFRYIYGKPIFVGFGFRRPWEDGHGILSQHYAGLAFDVGQNLDDRGRAALRSLAVNSGIWNYVEPVSETPRWVHFDERQVASGYPITRQGSRGVYVCIAQDCLTTLGYETGGLDGIFGIKTNFAVRSFQTQNSLVQDGIIGPLTWNRLMSQVVGKGPTDTSILAE
jgi:hypothetical protein